MAIKVGINGFGRIGRVALRIMVERGSSSYQICGINLRNADLDYMVYQVKYDSVFRRDELERFRPSPNPQANAGKYPHSHPCPLRFSG